MNKLISQTMKNLLVLTTGIVSFSIPLQFQSPTMIAQNSQAVIYAPPSNVRVTPNGGILCNIKKVTTINTYGYNNGWYSTDVCGSRGYIHESQIRFQNTYQPNSSSISCFVTNIETGQLAVRQSPGGKSIAGLNNNDQVQYIRGEMPWFYIRVISGPNSAVNGKTGWVNANYLQCDY